MTSPQPSTSSVNGRANGTKAVTRALDVLSSFIDASEQGITQISGRVGLSPSTTHRIVRALVDASYLEQDLSTERYRLGHAAIVLGQRANESLNLSEVQPVLERLGSVTGESVNLGIRHGDEVVVVVRVESNHTLRFDQPVGSRIPLHCTSMGKSLLAFSGEPLPRLALERVTATTITESEAFAAELATVRTNGFSLDNEESIEGVRCVASPILNVDGVAVAALAVQAPTVRMSLERQRALAAQVMAAADEIRSLLNLDTTRRQLGRLPYQ